MPGTRLIDHTYPVVALHAVTPSGSVPKRVSLKHFNHITILLSWKNGASGVAGSAITLLQSQDVAGTNEKALAFDLAFVNTDDSASSAVAQQAVGGNTFTLDATASKNGFAVIEVDASALDVNGGFDCIRVGTGNAVAQTVEVTYWLSGSDVGGASYGYCDPRAN